MNRCTMILPIILVAVFAFTTTSVQAANFYLQADIPNGGWWDQTSRWFDQSAGGGNNPASFENTDDYFTNGFLLRTRSGDLGVKSITVDDKVNVQSTNSTSIIAHLIIQGSALFDQNRDNCAITAPLLTMNGDMLFDANSHGGGMDLTATTIEGAGELKLSGDGLRDIELTLTDASGYTGDIVVDNDDFILNFMNDVNSGGSLVVLGTTGQIILDRDLTFTAATINGNGLANGVYDFATLNAAYDATFVDGGTGSITIIPEPASLGLALVGLMACLHRRRG